MITEKPSWVRHEGMQIFSIDIQAGCLRFATGGGDHKVRIWNMKSVGRDADNDHSQRLLATLWDHFGSVNCVRWAKHGRYLASGSDDQVILVYERKPGSGTTEFGSGQPPDVENWKVAMTLRGHTADVVDLNWSPDDLSLASGSLDNTIHIWNMTNGICTAVLRGHSSLVKGVSWDPIGTFIASQSDDKTVIIWRTSDWSLAHRTDGHWSKSLGSTFFRRLGWSPCGHFITTTHGFQKPRHSAPVLERGEWSATFDFLGHNAPITVVKFNHSMFRKHFSNGQEVKSPSTGWANGTSKSTGKEHQPYNVIAIGSQDRTITVWTTASARPLFVAKHFFTQSVVDLSWSSDGYALFASSLDGSVATFHFEMKELGQRLSDTELDELKKSRYGDARGRQVTVAESPAQLLLEAVAAKQSASKKGPSVLQQSQTIKASIDPVNVIVNQPITKPPETLAEDAKKSSNDSLDQLAPGRTSNPVKQREYRRPDGRKRIIPEALGVSSHQENISGATQVADFSSLTSDQQKNGHGMMIPAENGVKEVSFKRPFNACSDATNGTVKFNNFGSKERSGITARANIHESLVIEKSPTLASTDDRMHVEPSRIVGMPGSLSSCSALSIQIFNKKDDDDSLPICLEAKPMERSMNDMIGVGNAFSTKETEITCTKGAQILWSDRICGKVTALAGNANFWAVGCEDGCLQVYTKCGSRSMPTMMMGSSAVFIDCNEYWELLLVTKRGLLYVWDLFNRKCILHDSLASLVSSREDTPSKDAGTIRVISAKFSKSGSPLVVLASRHAFLFDMSMKCWLRIADDCFPASNFASSFSLSSIHSGELGNLQVDVGKFMARKPTWTRVTDDGVQTRAHLETQLASALALKSPNEYRQCLLAYIRFLASSEWLRSDSRRTAVGLDLDLEALNWCLENNICKIGCDGYSRISLFHGNVLHPRKAHMINHKAQDLNCQKVYMETPQLYRVADASVEASSAMEKASLPPRDIICAFNYSCCCLQRRVDLVRYFKHALDALSKKGGIFVMDLYGGTSSEHKLRLQRKFSNFTYVWEQAEFDIISRRTRISLHFQRGKKWIFRHAFSYDWRLWSLPEIRECMEEAGFESIHFWLREMPSTEEEVHCKEYDANSDVKYEELSVFMQQDSWNAYVVGVANLYVQC